MRAYQILQERDDQVTTKYIFEDNKSKKDDLSDVLTQALAYQILKLKK